MPYSEERCDKKHSSITTTFWVIVGISVPSLLTIVGLTINAYSNDLTTTTASIETQKVKMAEYSTKLAVLETKLDILQKDLGEVKSMNKEILAAVKK